MLEQCLSLLAPMKGKILCYCVQRHCRQLCVSNIVATVWQRTTYLRPRSGQIVVKTNVDLFRMFGNLLLLGDYSGTTMTLGL